MNDIDRWIYFEGPEPESIRPLLSALREVDTPRPTPEDKARAMAEFFETLDARLGRATEGRAEQARGSAPAGVPAPPPDAAGSAGEPRAAEEGEAPLGFEAWAELSIRLIGAPVEETLAALAARSLTLEDWTRLDDDYLRLLSADMRARRTERPALYAIKWNEDMARRTKAAESAEEAAAAVAGPAVVSAPEALTGTADLVDMPAAVWAAMGKLPFKPAPPGPPAPGKGTVKTVPVPVMPSSLDETLPLGSDAMQKAIAAVPFAGSTAGAGVVPFPVLTVQQYVSLRADLAGMPERWTETLRRYGVPSEVSRRALDEHWQQQLAERPALRAELDAAVAMYTSWLRGLPR